MPAIRSFAPIFRRRRGLPGPNTFLIMAIAIVIEVLLGAAALLVLTFATVLLVEIASAIVLPEWAASADGERRSVAVLIPAHDE